MKTEDGLIIGGVVLGGALLIYLVSSKKSTSLSSAAANSNLASAGGFLSGLGSLAGGIGKLIGGSSTGSPPPAYSSTSAPNSSGPSPIGYDSQGFFTVSDAEIGNVTAYDAQGTTDAPVFGIAGLDYAD